MIPRDVRYIVSSLPMQAGLVPVGAPPPPPPPTPVAALENVPGSMVVGIQATAQVHNTGTVPATWGIGTGSGLTVSPSTGTLAPGAVQALTLDATAANTYTLTLTVTGGTGGAASITANPGVVAPVPNFIGAPAAGTVPFTTTFTNQSTGTYSALLWDFGDGSTSTSANPTHAYTVPGTYTVTLTLTWAGGTVPFTRTAYITASAATSATGQQLSGSTTGTTGSPTTWTVTLNGPVPIGGGTTTISAPGATLSASTLTWTFGGPTSQTFTIQRAADGATSVGVTNSMGLSNGTALGYTSSSSADPTIVNVVLRGGATGTQPFAIGHAFKQGDLVSGASLNGLQLNALTTWPDGSVKTAIVAGYAAVTSGADKTVSLASGAATSGTAVSTASLASVTARHDCGTFGAVNWSSSDWATPLLTVCTGPVMSSWVYRKAVGSDPHLVAWLEVRAYANGEVQVLPWVENGYIAVASPTNKSATYAFSLNGSAKCAGVAIDLKHHQRTPLINGAALSYWAGTDPGIVPIHNAAYLQSTELVPSYYSSLSAGDAKVAALPSSYAPLQQGSFTYDSDAMTSTGYQAPIGLLPQHDVLHLIAADADRASTFKAVVRNGFSAGRYPIHYRDENTNKLLRFQDHPNRVICDNSGFASNGSSTTASVTPTPTGTLPPSWDTAHSPSVGYMAALLTGFRYFIEEAQFAATCNYLGNGDNAALRNGSQGLVQTAVDAWQTRASAWDWRAHVQALTLTPSTDQIYTDMVSRAHNNVDHFHGRYVAQANNAFGIILPGETYTSSISRVAIWQQDFHTAAWGYSKCLGLPLDATRTARQTAFFAWKAQSIIGRLGISSAFPFENANRYVVELGTSLAYTGYTNGTGPWPASWTAIYSTTAPLADSTSNPLATAGGNVLATEYDAIAGAKGQWGELQMAIAYAVRHGVSGASAAYNRMIGATNWASMLTSQWSASYPVMGVKPYTDPVSLPAWLSGKPLREWFQISGTSGAGGAHGYAYCGAWLDLVNSKLGMSGPGGHGDGYDNRSVVLNLLQDTPAWATLRADAGATENDVFYYTVDGSRASSHTYSFSHYVTQRSRAMIFGFFGGYPNAHTSPQIDGQNTTTGAWDVAGTWANLTADGQFGQCMDAATGDVWGVVGTKVHKWAQATATHSVLQDFGGVGEMARTSCWDSSRSQLFTIGFGNGRDPDGTKTFYAYKIPSAGTSRTIITLSGGAAAQYLNSAPYSQALEYDSANDVFYAYAGGLGASGAVDSPKDIYVITPNSGSTWGCELMVHGSGSITPVASCSAGVHNRFRYVPGLGAIVYVAFNTSNTSPAVYAMRVS
jgi:PKD repeat protein